MPPFKIVITEKENLISIKTKIDSMNPKTILLESGEVDGSYQLIINQKTNYIAQKLMNDNWKIDKVKYYKGKLFKVIMSRIMAPCRHSEGMESI